MVSWEFTGNGRFRRRSPENGFGDDFSQWRNSGVPVGRSIATAPNFHKLPRRIWENRHESGNPTVLPHNRTRTRKYRAPLLRLSFGAASTPAPTRVKGKDTDASCNGACSARKNEKPASRYAMRVVCGARGIRTPDPLHAMEMRYQLRHSPGRSSVIRSVLRGPRIQYNTIG